MNSRRSGFVKFNSAASALLTFVLLVPGGASAKDHKPRESDSAAHVVAHLSFSGLSDIDMAMQKKVNDKYYLYVQHAKDEGISIIDISEPAQPKAVAITPWPDPAVSSRMNVTGDLAIIAENMNPETRSSTSNDDLVVWDLSNPASPRIVQRFSGVVKWLQDERNFIYVLNGDGLWVVSKPVAPSQTNSSSSYGG
ncbi:MAG: hypothetical protein WB660_31805 [Candidatus Sulfotelmatobacter sp.]